MTLDEAIKRVEEKAEEQRQKAKEYHQAQVNKCETIPFAEMDYTYENGCIKCAEEHQQLAEWLKELKDYKDKEDKELENQKTGHWIKQHIGQITTYKCSECGRTVKDDTGYDVIKDYPYCNCGAKMEGEQRMNKIYGTDGNVYETSISNGVENTTNTSNELSVLKENPIIQKEKEVFVIAELESIRKDILKLIETKTETEENSRYLLGLHKAALVVDEHIISNLKGENNECLTILKFYT